MTAAGRLQYVMSADSIAFDSVLHLCQPQHRRIVLGTLVEERRSLTPSDLAKAILEHDQRTPITETSEDVLAEIRLSLYHVDLPKLASAGLISYDPKRQLVEPTEQLVSMQPILTTIFDADPSLEAPMNL